MKNSIPFLFILFGLPAFAQEIPDDRREEIEAQKAAFITRELNLTAKESQAFWPVYNEYQGEIEANRDKMRAITKTAKREMADMSDEEADALMKNRFELERERVDIEERYYKEFKKVLSVKRVAAFYKAEKDFKRELLRMIRDGNGDKDRMRERP